MGVDAKITYGVIKFTQDGKCSIVQKLNGTPVNLYDAYDRKSHFILYPNRRIIPSNVPLEKHSVDILDTHREY